MFRKFFSAALALLLITGDGALAAPKKKKSLLEDQPSSTSARVPSSDGQARGVMYRGVPSPDAGSGVMGRNIPARENQHGSSNGLTMRDLSQHFSGVRVVTPPHQ